MDIDTYLLAIALILGSTAVSVVGLVCARKMTSLSRLKECHEVGGYLLSVIGTLYAVLLGLIVVDAMSKFQLARNYVEAEANSLADIFMLAERFPEERKIRIQKLCADYASEVVDNEWPAMDRGKVSPVARRTAIQLIRSVANFEPVTESQKAVYPIAISEACQLWDNRRARTNASDYGIPEIEWVVLILGGAVTVIFTYFFGLENLKAQMLMTGMCSFLIALNIYLVLLFGYPFSGDLSVEPDAFIVDQQIFLNQLDVALTP